MASDVYTDKSINELVRFFCRERLLVEPLFWTNRHLELLQCSFTGPVSSNPTVQSRYIGELSGAIWIASMRRSWRKRGREDAIRALVSWTDCPLMPGRDVTFFFESRARVVLPCTSLHDRHDEARRPRPPPTAVYIDLRRIRRLRDDLLYPYIYARRTKRKYKAIPYALYMRKIKRITPADPLLDPYIVALLIAAAQEQQRAALELSEPQKCPITFTARVLLSSDDEESMYLYTADITSSFLHKLYDPASSPVGPTPLLIYITSVPYRPFESLRDRIFALLIPLEGSETDTGYEGDRETPTSGPEK